MSDLSSPVTKDGVLSPVKKNEKVSDSQVGLVAILSNPIATKRKSKKRVSFCRTVDFQNYNYNSPAPEDSSENRPPTKIGQLLTAQILTCPRPQRDRGSMELTCCGYPETVFHEVNMDVSSNNQTAFDEVDMELSSNKSACHKVDMDLSSDNKTRVLAEDMELTLQCCTPPLPISAANENWKPQDMSFTLQNRNAFTGEVLEPKDMSLTGHAAHKWPLTRETSNPKNVSLATQNKSVFREECSIFDRLVKKSALVETERESLADDTVRGPLTCTQLSLEKNASEREGSLMKESCQHAEETETFCDEEKRSSEKMPANETVSMKMDGNDSATALDDENSESEPDRKMDTEEKSGIMKEMEMQSVSQILDVSIPQTTPSVKKEQNESQRQVFVARVTPESFTCTEIPVISADEGDVASCSERCEEDDDDDDNDDDPSPSKLRRILSRSADASVHTNVSLSSTLNESAMPTALKACSASTPIMKNVKAASSPVPEPEPEQVEPEQVDPAQPFRTMLDRINSDILWRLNCFTPGFVSFTYCSKLGNRLVDRMALAVYFSVDSSTCSDDAVPLTRIELKIMKEHFDEFKCFGYSLLSAYYSQPHLIEKYPTNGHLEQLLTDVTENIKKVNLLMRTLFDLPDSSYSLDDSDVLCISSMGSNPTYGMVAKYKFAFGNQGFAINLISTEVAFGMKEKAVARANEMLQKLITSI